MAETYEQLEFPIIKKAISRYCSFSLGEKLILESMPRFSALQARRELARGQEAFRLYVAYREPSFAGISDIFNTINHARKGGVCDAASLYAVASFSSGILAIKAYRKESTLETPYMDEIFTSLYEQPMIQNAIYDAINPAFEVKDNASSELRSIRIRIRRTNQDIAQQTASLLSMYSSILMEHITVMRNNRTCLLVKAGEKHKIKGYVHGESASRQAAYIEPESLVRLNNELENLQEKEQDEIYKILRDLSQKVQKEADHYVSDLDNVALLDSLFAKAKWCYENEGCFASIKEGEGIVFKQARHPLIDAKQVVANTYRIQKPYKHLLITGSNTGGKSVTLKTIGLFTIMSYAGFPISCEEAILPIFDAVFVDIGDSQSIVSSLSTFSAHVSALASITKQASEHSLVLLDELGSGTDPKEGECLAIATLDYFRQRNVTCIATTHYFGLKEYAKKQEDVLIASLLFDMEALKPTYRYLEGYSGSSNAFDIAGNYGLDDAIVMEARRLKEATKSENERLLEKLDEDRLQMERMQEILKQKEQELDASLARLREERKVFNESKESILNKAQNDADQIRQEAQLEAELIIEELKGMKDRPVKEHELIELKHALNVQETSIVADEEIESEEIGEHDYVRIKKMNYQGEVIQLRGNRATVLVNGMKMNVKINELEKIQKPKTKKTKGYASHLSSRPFHGECNVIGLHVDEALSVVDKHLDDCLMHRYYTTRIIHGYGTGALRSAIQNYLKHNKVVESYRFGGENEGGLGATIVTLKHGENHG